MRMLLATVLLLIGLAAIGCSSAPPPAPAGPSADTLVLKGEKGEATIKLKGMDVFLVENEKEYPELFGIHGDDLVLVGEFPKDVHVGYGEAWDKIVGKTVLFTERGGGGKDEEESALVPPGGKKGVVKQGWLVIDKVGTKDGKGGTVLEGHLQVTVDGKKYDGKFVVTAKTWG